MKLYDIISFNNELDMLDIRFDILDKFVDYFVIVEATETFSGVSKPMHCLSNYTRYDKYIGKILHIAIEDTPESFTDPHCDQRVLELACNSSNVTREHLCWLKEFYQKEMIANFIEYLDDDDICVVSDVDEVWNPEILKSVVSDDIYKPKINNCYAEYLNVMTDEDWTYFTGPIIARASSLSGKCLNHLRTQSKMKDVYTFIEDGGWHFNALGGAQKKIDDFKHPVYTEQYMRGRTANTRIDESKLPHTILDNRDKYSKFFK